MLKLGCVEGLRAAALACQGCVVCVSSTRLEQRRENMADQGVLMHASAEDEVLARARRSALYHRLESESEVRLGREAASKIRTWMTQNHRQMRRTFAALDRNGDGTLTVAEAVQGLQSINDSGLSVQEIRAAVISMDTDGSGDLDYHEFFEQVHCAGEEAFDASVPRVHTLASMGDEVGLVAELQSSGGSGGGGATALVNGLHTSKANWRGRTPLMAASFAGQLSTVKALLAERADTNCMDSKNWTALMGAAAGGHHEVCTALCRAGANPELKNTAGQTAGDLAALYGLDAVTEALVPYAGKDGAGVPAFLRPLDRPR